MRDDGPVCWCQAEAGDAAAGKEESGVFVFLFSPTPIVWIWGQHRKVSPTNAQPKLESVRLHQHYNVLHKLFVWVAARRVLLSFETWKCTFSVWNPAWMGEVMLMCVYCGIQVERLSHSQDFERLTVEPKPGIIWFHVYYTIWLSSTGSYEGEKSTVFGTHPYPRCFFFVCLFFCKDLEKQRLLCRGKITFWNRLTSSFGKVQFIYENSLRWNVVLLTYLNSCAEQCPWFYFAAMLQKMSMLTQCSMSLLQHYVPVVKYCIAQHGNLCQGFYFSNGSCFSKGEIKKRSMYPTVIIATE